MKLTNSCRIPKINDLSADEGQNVIAYAGDFVIVNCFRAKLPDHFAVDPNFEVFEGGEVAALVLDWTDDSGEVMARRQVSTDSCRVCSGACEIFQLANVSTVENHLIGQTQCHSFAGFSCTSTEWKLPLITSWMASRRKDANHVDYDWDSAKDPQMKKLKSIFLETLPCSLSRFDIVQTKAETMHQLAFISEIELQMLATFSDAKLRNFELLILQLLPEPDTPNWKKVNVIFISNWRAAVAKICHNDFDEFLRANVWYLDRFDFEEVLFQQSATIDAFESVEELKAAQSLHDILVGEFFHSYSSNLFPLLADWRFGQVHERLPKKRPQPVQRESSYLHVASPESFE